MNNIYIYIYLRVHANLVPASVIQHKRASSALTTLGAHCASHVRMHVQHLEEITYTL